MDSRSCTSQVYPSAPLCLLCHPPPTISHVKNSREFVDFIKSQTLTSDETMMSFDMVSLFTCISMDLAVQVARSRPENDASLPEYTSLSVDDIVDLLTL